MKIIESKILLLLMFLLLETESASADSINDITVEVHQEVQKDESSRCGCNGCCDPCNELAELKELVTTLAACLKDTKESVAEIKETVAELSERNCTEDNVVCPSPFTKVGEECLYRSELKKNWDDAREYCIKQGGDLATPEDVPFLQEYLKKSGTHVTVWIGGHDQEKPGLWKYLNGEDIKESDWYVTQPDYLGKQRCLELRTYLNPPLSNHWCHVTQGFVCQYGAPGCPPDVGCGRRIIE